jgi:hypothetical protein
VDDAQAAAAYYRDVLGFEQIATLGGNPPRFALVRRYGALVLLQSAPDQARAQRGAGPPWDAVLMVDDVPAAHADLTRRGARVSDVDGRGIGWDSFEVVDCCGNVLCLGESAQRLLDRLTPPRPPLFQQAAGRVLQTWHRRRSVAQERALTREFRAFYERLDNKHGIFYMFFTTGLLHWVAQAASFVPPEVNLVLVGSALTDDEREWLARRSGRPFHHIRLPVDDVTAWEMFFATNRYDFGWLDIDCFVLNEELFTQLTAIDPGVSVNCAWSWDTGHGFRLANTHFLFVNVAAIRAVAAHGVSTSPCTYDWSGSQRPFGPRRCYLKTPTRRQRELMLKVLPADADGRPMLLWDSSYFNTLVTYQLLARAVGYPIGQVRDLSRRCVMPENVDSNDPEDWPEDMSDELFHLFGISYYRNYDYQPDITALYLAAECIMLDNTVADLPSSYAERRASVAAELAALRVRDPRALFRDHLVHARGLTEAAADKVVARATPAPVAP